MNTSSMHCTILTYDMQTYYCTHACTHTQVSHHSSQTRYQCSFGMKDTCHANTHTFGLLAYERYTWVLFQKPKDSQRSGLARPTPVSRSEWLLGTIAVQIAVEACRLDTHTHTHAHTRTHMAAQCYALHALVIVHLQLAATSLFCSSSCRYGRWCTYICTCVRTVHTTD